MRIHSGRLRGRDVPAPPGWQTRPTTDVIKESVFSVIEHRLPIERASVLDLFAGSGQLAWEALSRGAATATLVDSSAEVCRHLRAVSVALGVSPQVTIVRSDVLSFLTNVHAEPVDLVFIDPPYHLRCCNRVVGALLAREVLAPGAVIVVEHGDQEALLPVEGYSNVWHRERSSTVVDILVHQAIQP